MPAPLEFHPIIKRIRWGGTRLGTHLGKRIGDATDAAESWEIVDHGTDQSVVSGGPWAGRVLAELVRDSNAELFGRHAGLGQFPLLVKFLDATDRLSVQVHPNDAQAKAFDPRENGKTEAWVIVDAAPDSRLFAGLKAGVDRGQLEGRLADGTLADCLHSFTVRPGDFVFIPAGTVHAIGEGILLAEIQQSSDLTFRLYDWGRVGTDGKPRPLHIAESLACIDFDRGPVSSTGSSPGSQSICAGESRHEELVRCPCFVIQRHVAGRPFVLPGDDRFHVLMGLEGAALVQSGRELTPIQKGRTLLVPARRESTRVEPEGVAVVLDAFLP